jgi:hypothetical protein
LNHCAAQPNPDLVEIASNGLWPPSPMMHLAVMHDNNWQIAEVQEVKSDLTASVHLFTKLDLPNYETLSLWQHLDSETVSEEKSSVLPARPMVDIVRCLSTMSRSRRKIIYQLENPQMFDSFVRRKPDGI